MNRASNKKRKVGIIGAGLGGLSAAVRLAHAGCEVTVFEKNGGVGGKMNHHEQGGFTWDTGPSLLTMPQVLRELFEEVGEKMEDHLTLIPLETTCRYRWRDGTTIDENADFWKRPDVSKFLKYARGIYEISADAFLRNDLSDWWRLLKVENLRKLLHFPKMADPRSMHHVVSRAFRDPHVRQIFDRFATYNGSSPYRTPAAFNIIPFVQAEFGGWYVQGGMFRIAEALEKLACARGVKFRFGESVTGMTRRPGGYGLAIDGNWEAFDGVVCNKDSVLSYQNLVPREVASWFKNRFLHKRDISTSGFILCLGVKKQYPGLAHHNIFFSDDYKTEFTELFGARQPAQQPTIYVCSSSRTEAGRAPEGCDNWFVLVNAPALRSTMRWSQFGEEYAERVIDQLQFEFGFEGLRQQIVERTMYTPADFRKVYSSYAGSIYGFASHGLFKAFLRPPMSHPLLPKFHFAGGTTHPGGGIPLVLLSGGIAARKLLAEFAHD